MSKIKLGTMIMVISHGNTKTKQLPPLGATGEVIVEIPDSLNRYGILFPKEPVGLQRFLVNRQLFIILDDGDLNKNELFEDDWLDNKNKLPVEAFYEPEQFWKKL